MTKHHLALLALAITLANAAQADCPPAEQLQQAFFSLTPATSGAITELHNKELSHTNRLYFFTQVTGNNSGALLHRWRHNQRIVANVRLQNGSSSWQSWSAQALDTEAGDWQVDILDDHLCLLGTRTLLLHAKDAVLAQAQALLAKHDVIGAKLALKAALARTDASRADKRRWQDFMETELALAEAAANIQQQQLVAAEGRLQALTGKLSGALLARYQTLVQQLAIAKQAADQRSLFQHMAAIRSLAISSRCPDNKEGAQQLLAPLLPQGQSGITAFQKDKNQINLTITLPSGAAKQLSWSCQPLLVLP